MGDTLIAIGGYDGNQYLRTVEKYDSEANEWTQLAPINYSRAGACIVSIPNVFSNTVTPCSSSTSNNNGHNNNNNNCTIPQAPTNAQTQ